MKKLKIIWQLLFNRHYVVVTGNYWWEHIHYDMPPKEIKKAICRLEVQLQADENVAEAKEIVEVRK